MNFKAQISADQLYRLTVGAPISIRLPKEEGREETRITVTMTPLASGETITVKHTQSTHSKPDIFDRMFDNMDRMFKNMDRAISKFHF